MIIPDIIVSWPRNCDYPLWRQFIRNNRSRFNEIIIAFTETNQGEDYRAFIRKSMFEDYVHFVEPRSLKPGEDWRDAAINDSLIHSYNAEWIWFTEQDFMVTHDLFWIDVEEAHRLHNILGVYQGNRLHPCSIFIKRKLLDQTSKNFAVVPGIGDHFSKFQKDIEALQSPIYELTAGFKHLNGLSHNMTLLARNEAPNYQVEEFKTWLKDCLAVSVPLDDRFVRLAKTIL